MVKLQVTKSDSAQGGPHRLVVQKSQACGSGPTWERGYEAAPPPEALAEILTWGQGTLYRDWGFLKRC